jgi:alkaline phosphatase
VTRLEECLVAIVTGLRRSIAPAALVVSLAVALGIALSAVAAPARAASDPAAGRPRNVILMIPDGCGWASMTLARLVAGRPLVLDAILVGASETHPADGLITDSAAGATAFASGVKTRNYELGLTPDQRPAATVLEAARARGLSTGLVATNRITDATPAAFAAHVSSRWDETEIALEELDHRVDVLLGGGRREFLPAAAGGLRKDGRDLTDEARRAGYSVITSRAQLATAVSTPLLGLFTPDHMNYEIDRDTLADPSLAEMTKKALALLARNRRGFFVMIEGSRVDHAAHQRDPATHAREVLAYDDAVAVALEFARRDAHTLVISVADHETGGLSVGLWSDRDSTTLLKPEMLRQVRESAARMAGEIRGGAAADEVLARGAGVTDLSPEERAALAAGGPGDRGLVGTIGSIESRRAQVGWTTWWHTGVDVGLYAWGPGSGRLRGTHENTDVAWTIAGLLGLDLEGLTARERNAAAGPGRR